jgi:hypothetical protein
VRLGLLWLSGLICAGAVQSGELDGPTAARTGLQYLLRHQSEDGSWGKRPRSCSCPMPPFKTLPDPEVGPADLDTDRIVTSLGSEDPEKRIASQKQLEALGTKGLPALRKGLLSPDLEIRNRCRELIDAVARSLETSSVRSTALAVFAFLSQQVVPTSSESTGDTSLGEAVKKGLKWLISAQKEDGGFDSDDARADAIAGLAVSEAYLLTRVDTLRICSERALEHLRLIKTSDPAFRVIRAMAFERGLQAKLYEKIPLDLEREEADVAAGNELSDLVALAYIQGLRKQQIPEELIENLRRAPIGELGPETLSIRLIPLFSQGVWSRVARKEARNSVRGAIWAAQHNGTGCQRGSWGKGEYREALELSASVISFLTYTAAAAAYEPK